MRERHIKLLTVVILLFLALWSSYEFYFKYAINDYQAKQIEIRLRENFYKNESTFHNINKVTQQFGQIENLEFKDDGNISLVIYDTMANSKDYCFTPIYITDNQDSLIKAISFLDNGSLLISLRDTSVVIDSCWRIEFTGTLQHPLLAQALAYSCISTVQLTELQKLLTKIDCNHFSKGAGNIQIRYAGHTFVNFSYYIPLIDNGKSSIQEVHKLADGFYWSYFQAGLYCEWMDW